MELKNIMAGFVVAWIIGAVLSLALLGGLIYVACHFIAKAW